MTVIPRVVTPRVVVPAVLTPRTTGAPVGGSPFLLFNGDTSEVTVSDHASLQNLPTLANGFTLDLVARPDSLGEDSMGGIAYKGTGSWLVRFASSDRLRFRVQYDDTDADALKVYTLDGAWHHYAFTYNENGDRKARVWIDGVLWDTSGASVGTYNDDAGEDMIVGLIGGDTFDGAFAWLRLSNTVRYSAAFTPPLRWPRPAIDANTVEQWNMDEGAGSSLASQVQPWAVRFNGSNSVINYGSDASLDDLPDGAEITVEAWVKGDSTADNDFTFILSKGSWTESGWSIYNHSNGRLYAYINLDGDAVICSAATILDDSWHHIALYYNDTTNVARMAVDGVWGYASSAGSGDYIADASLALAAGRKAHHASGYFTGDIGWIRISNNDRHTAGTDFDGSLPSRYAPPAADGNTVEQWSNNEGTGSTVSAGVDGSNDGSISNGEWIPTGGINDATLTDTTWGTG